jgi:hypothetical protein
MFSVKGNESPPSGCHRASEGNESMKFKLVKAPIEAKVLNYIRNVQYSDGIKMLQEYIALPKFIPQDGFIHGSVNVNDIKLRLDAIEHNVWAIGPVEYFLNEMEHNWSIVFNDRMDDAGNYLDGFYLENADKSIAEIGPFKSRWDAAIYGVEMLTKGVVVH